MLVKKFTEALEYRFEDGLNLLWKDFNKAEMLIPTADDGYAITSRRECIAKYTFNDYVICVYTCNSSCGCGEYIIYDNAGWELDFGSFYFIKDFHKCLNDIFKIIVY
jgi:hypothetical protein